MKSPFAHFCVARLLRLYPRPWRERYAEEVAALLEQRPPTVRTLFDLLLSIVDAYLHADLFTARPNVLRQRLHSSQFMIYCCAVFFSCLLALYMSQSSLFWYSNLLNQREYRLVYGLLNDCTTLLMLTTLVGSLVFIVRSLKRVLTEKSRSGFFIWGLVGATGNASLSYVVAQIAVPVGSSSALAQVLILLPTLCSFLTLFSNEFCIALVFAGVHEGLKKRKENQFWSSMMWIVGVCVPLVLMTATYRFAVFGSSTVVQGGNIFIALLVFGWCFLHRQRNRGTGPAVPLSYLSFLPVALITLIMNVLLLLTLLLTIGLYIGISNLGLMHYTFFNSLLLSMIVLALLTSLALWRGFLARNALVALVSLSHEEEDEGMYQEVRSPR